MCNKCHEFPATDVITPEAGFDESRKSTATTCRACAMKDDTNVYVKDAAVCGHGMERYKEMLECKECVERRQINNIVNSGGVCRECRVDLTHDNININHGSICIRCNKNAKAVTNEKNKIDVQCGDCGGTFRKYKHRTGKAVKELRLCNNLINAVNLPCNLICHEKKVVGDITMRCRYAKYVASSSKCCGAKNKCKSHKRKGDGHWFVCLPVQDDRKTPESLLGSSENDQDDRKMPAV
jgi:hypothetical protein